MDPLVEAFLMFMGAGLLIAIIGLIVAYRGKKSTA